ncbi:TetR/AcrR family transcriptional regulator C-terminal domain-containing protein [Thermostaphylospora chromogena]|uniref:DNA-binding transcriptional regulator, AcrR family n=1 Tax=Thermostaphylospora chromogena TaxID=35622 RepID=A0A1H1GZ83_9ACTN|nr:TetR/AcrR family transcriptional regulator C-terminal domain-containing protein [Thermostaphylospora chromogena]SDR18178.1 DNA-binding transcriptional regulator, AcrR family [Thermostaphylospora chromogena]
MPAKRPPIPLSRERIIEAALDIADTQGLRRLTMRRLGEALQVEAMAIYHHLPGGKEALLDALAQHVTTVSVDPSGLPDWREIARAWCRAGRQALLAHPGVLSLAMTKPPRGSAAAAIGEQVRQLADAGLREPAAAVRTLRSYVFGSVAVELQQTGWADPKAQPVMPEPDGEAAFERGLTALLTGLERFAET